MTAPQTPPKTEETSPQTSKVVLAYEPENVVVAWVKKLLQINYMTYGTKKSF